MQGIEGPKRMFLHKLSAYLGHAFGEFDYKIILPILLKIREDVSVFLFAQLALSELSGQTGPHFHVGHPRSRNDLSFFKSALTAWEPGSFT